MEEKNKKAKNEICEKVGETTGSIVRCVIDTVKKTGKTGESVAKFADKYTKVTAEGCKNIYSKVDNLRKRIEYKYKLRELKNEQKKVFTKIGEMIFNKKELEESPEKILHEKGIQELLKNAELCEDKILKIEKEIENLVQKTEIKESSPVRSRVIHKKKIPRVHTSESVPQGSTP